MVKMRMWTGPEMEGPYEGVTTLFVECEHFDKEVRENIEAMLYDYTLKIKAVYLGAGRVDLRNIDAYELDVFFRGCRKFNKLMTVETSTQLVNYMEMGIDWTRVNIVYTIDLPNKASMLNNLFFKVEMPGQVEITKVRNTYVNRIDTVDDGMYEGADVLVYDNTEDKQC